MPLGAPLPALQRKCKESSGKWHWLFLLDPLHWLSGLSLDTSRGKCEMMGESQVQTLAEVGERGAKHSTGLSYLSESEREGDT